MFHSRILTPFSVIYSGSETKRKTENRVYDLEVNRIIEKDPRQNSNVIDGDQWMFYCCVNSSLLTKSRLKMYLPSSLNIAPLF